MESEGRGAAEGKGTEAPAPAPPARARAPVPAPVRYCAVYDCLHNYRTHPHLSFFGFPSDKQMVKIWVQKIRRPDIVQANGLVSSYYRVCEEHFEPKSINRNRRRARLLRRAVPALRLPHAGPYVTVVEPRAPAAASNRKAAHYVTVVEPRTPAPASNRKAAHYVTVVEPRAPAPASSRKAAGRKLVRSTMEVFEYVGNSKRKIIKKQRDHRDGLVAPSTSSAMPPALEGFSAECDRHLAPGMAEFVKLVARLRQAGDDGDRLNRLCLNLLHTSPSAYRLLRAALSLPTIQSLHRHCTPLLHDFDAKLTELLKTRFDRMTEREKQCTLSVEIIEVRPHLYYNITFDRIVGLHEVDGEQSPWPATRAAVVSARGLLASWTQPVAIGFLAREDVAFDCWLDKIISGLTAVGLTVRALVSDPAAPVHAPTNPEHFFLVGDTKIYRMYDTPSLMKMLLCNFIAYNFHFERSIAKWSDVLEYHNLEKHKRLTLTPGLSSVAADVTLVPRMSARRAARVLNRELAAALSGYIDRSQLPDSTRATVQLILKLNNLRDVLDSTTMKTTDFKKGLFKDPGQIAFLDYMKSFFKSLKLEDKGGIDRRETERLRDGWRVTIASVLALHEDLKATNAPLFTRRLHLDTKIGDAQRRPREPRHGKPTCRRVFLTFKKHFLDDMLRPPGENGGDRDFDLNGLLARVALAPEGGGERGAAAAPGAEEVTVRRREYRRVRLPERGAARAAAAFLLRAARRLHGDCAPARRYARRPPARDLLRLVRRLSAALRGALAAGARAAGLLRELLLDVHVLDCALPCACFPLERLKLLLLRLLLLRLLRHNRARFDARPDDARLIIDTLE